MVEKGIVSFIKLKLEHATTPEQIRQMLYRAGFSEGEIEAGFNELKKDHRDTHQHIVAQNDFLPPLTKSRQVNTQPVSEYKVSKDISSFYIDKTKVDLDVKKSENKNIVESHNKNRGGLFQGRLRRKDFILGFLFFFGVGYVTLAIGAVAIRLMSPEIWKAIQSIIQSDTDGMFLTTIPFILAPITLIMLSMITRRLHNLDMPGNLSWLFLVFFLPTSFVSQEPLLVALYVSMLVLFVVLITKKGHPSPNVHGDHPESKGSFFRRIFNI